ncbi:hypothetical protein BDW22DRAFT_1347530 [Trametopsis cervina]|nr:hypothetical protein BDW22DRAFT_1347530 [Trametopsis cervina]
MAMKNWTEPSMDHRFSPAVQGSDRGSGLNIGITTNTWGMQRDPAVYDDASAFRPERFLNESGSLETSVPGTHGQGHVNFGFGKRYGKPLYSGIICNMTFIGAASLLWAFSVQNPVDLDGKPLTSVAEAMTSTGVLTLILCSDINSSWIRPTTPFGGSAWGNASHNPVARYYESLQHSEKDVVWGGTTTIEKTQKVF